MIEKIDLFKELMPMLDKANLRSIAELPDDMIKRMSPYIALKIMSAVDNRATYNRATDAEAEYAILAVNEVVNKKFHNMGQHPKLQLMLISQASIVKSPGYKSGRISHYFPGKLIGDNIFKQINTWYPHWKEDEVKMFMRISSKEELIQLAMDYGMQDSQLKEWKKWLKSYGF